MSQTFEAYKAWKKQKKSEGWIYDHGMFMNPNAKTTKAKPRKSTTALFQSLDGGELQRKDIEEVLFTVAQDKKCPPLCKDGYMTALIGYHRTCGRLKRSLRGRNSFYTLTTKGREYAKDRGILMKQGVDTCGSQV